MKISTVKQADLALKLCGIVNAILTLRNCYDPDTTPALHKVAGYEWLAGKKRGFITQSGRVTVWHNDRQKVLPFGGFTFGLSEKGNRIVTGTHEAETNYSVNRFSQYGTG